MNKSSKEQEIAQQDSVDKDIEDIQFEEIVDMDEVQKKLQDRIYETEPANLTEILESENNSEQSSTTEDRNESEQKPVNIVPLKVSTDANAKKYVIYVEPDNIDFMENLSANERKEIINKILKEQNTISIKTKEHKARKRFLSHAILACITFIIAFPIMFIGVNKALMATINNYEVAKENFRKLYKEQGKIKMQMPEQVPNIKY